MPDAPSLLIADDDGSTRALLAARLRTRGYTVSEVKSGEEVLQTVGKRLPDLVILDVMMPGIDGFATLQQLRRKYSSTRLPVIILTALDGPSDAIEALRLGANDYSVKPLNFDQLLPRVQTHLQLKASTLSIGKYDLEALIGSGAAGSVYAARDRTLNRPVAIKILLRQYTVDRAVVQRFAQEAALMAKINHPNVVHLYDSGQEGEVYYLAMEHVPGSTLERQCKDAPLAPRAALQVARQVAAGLVELHRHGIVHRDIKPQNILLAGDKAKITDFGIALDLADSSRTRTVAGSLVYASPQQLLGQTDSRSDMYALGTTLFYALTGQPPFAESLPMTELFEKKFAAPPQISSINPAVPAPLARFVAQLMAPAPKQRFANDQLLLQELGHLS